MSARLRALAGRRAKLVGLALVTATVVVATDACVVADPPSDLAQPPELPPLIVRGSVVPTASAILGRWPKHFIVPVELADPRVTFSYSAFVDYNPITGEGIDGRSPVLSEFEEASTVGNIRTLDVPLDEPTSDRCHVVEIIVALRLTARTDPKNAHTPDAPGGDSVTWFYNPSGDLAGCPALDSGLPGPPDADVDGALP
jgi:hypothetical protein